MNLLWGFAAEEGCAAKHDCIGLLIVIHKECGNVFQVVQLLSIEGWEWLNGKCLSHLVKGVLVFFDAVGEAIKLA